MMMCLLPRIQSSLQALAFYCFVLALSNSKHGIDAATVEYEWELKPVLSQGEFSPDCFKYRDMVLVNKQNPGPTIEANAGDTIIVRVMNHHPSEAVTMHYHGLHMLNQPYVDGTAFTSQCTVGPMQSQVQEFVAGEWGTHYWHAHVSMSRVDGVQGPIIIHDEAVESSIKGVNPYDEELSIFLQDWYHSDGSTQRLGLDSEPFRWIGNAQSFLINGKGLYEPCAVNAEGGSNANGVVEQELRSSECTAACTAANSLTTFNVEAGKTYRLRLINAASLIGVNLAISNHNLTVIEAGGTMLTPFTVQNLDIAPGERYSVLVTMDQPPATYYMTTSVRYRNAGPSGMAFVKYANTTGIVAKTLAASSSIGVNPPSHPVWDDFEAGHKLLKSFFTDVPPIYRDYNALSAPVDRELYIIGTQNRRVDNNLLRWAANNITMSFGRTPLIVEAYRAVHKKNKGGSQTPTWPDVDIDNTIVVPDKPESSFDYQESITGSNRFVSATGVSIMKFMKGEVVQLVLQNARALNDVPEMHAWHLHGHSFWVVGSGEGNYNPNSDPDSFNLVNPLRTDTVTLLPLSWVALRFKTDNPGVWPFHCTMQAHFVMGMGFNFVVSPDLLEPPPQSATACLEDSTSMQLTSSSTDGVDNTKQNGDVHSNHGNDSSATLQHMDAPAILLLKLIAAVVLVIPLY